MIEKKTCPDCGRPMGADGVCAGCEHVKEGLPEAGTFACPGCGLDLPVYSAGEPCKFCGRVAFSEKTRFVWKNKELNPLSMIILGIGAVLMLIGAAATAIWGEMEFNYFEFFGFMMVAGGAVG